MKKCPECGNPSYDGAPVCGNCGYKFPKPKVKAPMQEDIFEDKPIIKKNENEQSTIEIIKDNKIVIGTIILITLIVIGIIIATGPSHNNSTKADGLKKYSDANISFSYPSIWKDANGNEVNACIIAGDNPNNYLRYGDSKPNWRVLGVYKMDENSLSAKMITSEPI